MSTWICKTTLIRIIFRSLKWRVIYSYKPNRCFIWTSLHTDGTACMHWLLLICIKMCCLCMACVCIPMRMNFGSTTDVLKIGISLDFWSASSGRFLGCPQLIISVRHHFHILFIFWRSYLCQTSSGLLDRNLGCLVFIWRV